MTCPICSAESTEKYRPFCSRRCADADLGRWLSGAYALPSSDPEDAADAKDVTTLASAQAAPKPH